MQTPTLKSLPWLLYLRRALMLNAALALLIAVIWFGLEWYDKANRPVGMPASQIQSMSFQLMDSAVVIGLTVNNQHRAYLMETLLGPSSHVINDQIKKIPVTVTYCTLDDCIRVFTDTKSKKALAITSAGLNSMRPKKMLIRVGEKTFWQDNLLPLLPSDSTKFPLETLQFERTTWGQWRQKHPNTDLYVGQTRRRVMDPRVRILSAPDIDAATTAQKSKHSSIK